MSGLSSVSTTTVRFLAPVVQGGWVATTSNKILKYLGESAWCKLGVFCVAFNILYEQQQTCALLLTWLWNLCVLMLL